MAFSAEDRVLIKCWGRIKCTVLDYEMRGKLQDQRVYRSRIRDIDQLKSRPIEEWQHFHQVFIDEAIRQWRPRLQARIRAHGGQFGHREKLCTDPHVYAVAVVDNFCFGVTSLNPLQALTDCTEIWWFVCNQTSHCWREILSKSDGLRVKAIELRLALHDNQSHR